MSKDFWVYCQTCGADKLVFKQLEYGVPVELWSKAVMHFVCSYCLSTKSFMHKNPNPDKKLTKQLAKAHYIEVLHGKRKTKTK